MVFDYEFMKQLVMVAIPTIVAVLTSILVTHSWQVKRETNEIKREILSRSNNFISKLLTSFNIFLNVNYEQIQSGSNFQKDIKDFKIDYYSTSKDLHELNRDVRFYYEDEIQKNISKTIKRTDHKTLEIYNQCINIISAGMNTSEDMRVKAEKDYNDLKDMAVKLEKEIPSLHFLTEFL